MLAEISTTGELQVCGITRVGRRFLVSCEQEQVVRAGLSPVWF